MKPRHLGQVPHILTRQLSLRRARAWVLGRQGRQTAVLGWPWKKLSRQLPWPWSSGHLGMITCIRSQEEMSVNTQCCTSKMNNIWRVKLLRVLVQKEATHPARAHANDIWKHREPPGAGSVSWPSFPVSNGIRLFREILWAKQSQSCLYVWIKSTGHCPFTKQHCLLSRPCQC